MGHGPQNALEPTAVQTTCGSQPPLLVAHTPVPAHETDPPPSSPQGLQKAVPPRSSQTVEGGQPPWSTVQGPVGTDDAQAMKTLAHAISQAGAAAGNRLIPQEYQPAPLPRRGEMPRPSQRDVTES